MNYGLESSSGIHYDVQQQTYVQERDGMTYKLDKETQQWIPSECQCHWSSIGYHRSGIRRNDGKIWSYLSRSK